MDLPQPSSTMCYFVRGELKGDVDFMVIISVSSLNDIPLYLLYDNEFMDYIPNYHVLVKCQA